METHEPALPSPRARRATRNQPWFGLIIELLDSRLRRRLGVSEYTRSADCLLRMQILRNTDDVVLRDGTRLRPGDRVIDLHFWNEQVPPIPADGPTLAWARRMHDSFERSLQELAHHLAARTDVDDIVAIRAIAALGAAPQRDQISRILSRFGFEVTASQEAPSLAQHIRRYGENILISLIILSYNAAALRPDTLRRIRVPAYLSRRVLNDRYGAAPPAARRPADLPQQTGNIPLHLARPVPDDDRMATGWARSRRLLASLMSLIMPASGSNSPL